VKAPIRLHTARLTLAPPTAADAREMFDRYASDPDVTRYLAWPTHRSVDDTLAFVAFSIVSWERWPAGPYLIRDRVTGRLLGGTGLDFDRPGEAMTGYVLAQDAWGRSYATEALEAMVGLARDLGLRRLYAFAHVDHAASRRVLEKGGLHLDRKWTGTRPFPCLEPVDQPAVCYELALVKDPAA
jgi:ribosomal-protein-alanine N-acetyltransferase